MYNEANIQRLIRHYKHVAKSNSPHANDVCTVEELNNCVDKTAKLIAQIAEELSTR